MNLQDLDARMESIRADLASLDGLADPSEEDVALQDTLIAEYDDLDGKAKPLRQRMAQLDRIRQVAGEPDNREEPSTRKAPEMFVRSNRDPLEDLDRVRANLVSREDLRARALDLIEADAKRNSWELPHDYAEQASIRAQGNPKIGQHILLTGTREYREAFRAYLDNPEANEHRLRAVTLTNASGGYMLPYVLDPQIILSNNASANPYRRVARVVQTTSNAWQGVNSAGVNAAIVGETVTAADASPTLGQIQIPVVKAAAWILGSYEALDDTNFGEQLPGLLADGRDRLESAYFTTGSGTTVPLGVVAAQGAGARVAPSTTGTAFNGTASIPDVYNLQAALPPRFRRSPAAAWMGNIATLNKVRAIDQYGGGSFWANLTSNTPASLLGQQVFEASDMNATLVGTSAASGTGNATLFYGDFNQMLIVDRVGVSMLYDPMIKGTGANAQLPAGEAGWYMFWRFSSSISTTAAFRYLTVS